MASESRLIEGRARGEIRALSVSSLVTYERCPHQYYIAHVLKLPPPMTPAMRLGTNIHAIIAAQFGQLALFPPALEPQLQHMLDTFRRSRFNVPPLAIELSFTRNFGAGAVCGRIDLILPGQSGGVEVVDFKSGSLRSRREIERSLQLPLYALAVGEIFGLMPEQLRYSYFFLQDGEEASFVPSAVSVGELEERVENMLADIRGGRFEAAPGCKCWACRSEMIGRRATNEDVT